LAHAACGGAPGWHPALVRCNFKRYSVLEQFDFETLPPALYGETSFAYACEAGGGYRRLSQGKQTGGLCPLTPPGGVWGQSPNEPIFTPNISILEMLAELSEALLTLP
jgi:hypothetical protein